MWKKRVKKYVPPKPVVYSPEEVVAQEEELDRAVRAARGAPQKQEEPEELPNWTHRKAPGIKEKVNVFIDEYLLPARRKRR